MLTPSESPTPSPVEASLLARWLKARQQARVLWREGLAQLSDDLQLIARSARRGLARLQQSSPARRARSLIGGLPSLTREGGRQWWGEAPALWLAIWPILNSAGRTLVTRWQQSHRALVPWLVLGGQVGVAIGFLIVLGLDAQAYVVRAAALEKHVLPAHADVRLLLAQPTAMPPTPTPAPTPTPEPVVTATPIVMPYTAWESALSQYGGWNGAEQCWGPVLAPVGSGAFIWPTDKHYLVGKNFSWRWHPALDLGGDTGDPIYAADSGAVVYAGWNTYGYGNLVILDHGNGWHTLYAHFSQVNVACGQAVEQGAILGLAGSTGRSTGPHLHFEMRFNHNYVNPWDYLP